MKIKKIMSILLATSMVISLTACGKTENQTTDTSIDTSTTHTVKEVNYDKPSDKYKKNETVYVNLSADGKVQSEIVTDWLHTDTAETYIDDISDLKDIENVKSNTEPQKGKDNSLRWNMPTTDLYYRGSTDKELPINFDITYYLDGKETTAKKIAGKSGQVKMVVTINNTSTKTVKIDGKDTVIYTPFIVAGGMILQENEFSNINVENGKTIGDGTKEIALMVGAPGLKESLNLSDALLKELGDFDFSNTFTITANTDNFEISNMIFAVLPLSAIGTELKDTLPGTVEDVQASLSKVQTIIDKFNSMNLNELLSTLFNNADNLSDLVSSLDEVTELYNNNKALIDVIEKYMTEENLTAIKTLIDDSEELDMDEVTKLLSNPILQRFFKQLPTISADIQNVMPILNGLQTDMENPEVQKAIENLPKTLETLKELKSKLDSNQELFNALSTTFNDDTINQLKSLMTSLDEIISKETIEKYTTLIGDTDLLIARAKEWVKLGNEYNKFTTATDKAETSVVFIYETASITAPKTTTEVTTAVTTESNPIKKWFDKTFKK